MVQGTRGKGGRFMKKRKIRYTDDNEIGEIKIVKDFLPSPKDLALREEKIKVTLTLTRSSVDFFKEQASTHHIGYQAMIRTLIDQYVARYHD